MSMVDVAPDVIQGLEIPEDLSALELSDEDRRVQQELRIGALAELFEDHPDWVSTAPWQGESLDRALETLAKADSNRDESQRIASLSAINVPALLDSTVLVRWPEAETIVSDVEVAYFQINDHVAVGFGGRWYLRYQAPQTDDIYELENGFWTELWGVCSELASRNQVQEAAEEESGELGYSAA